MPNAVISIPAARATLLASILPLNSRSRRIAGTFMLHSQNSKVSSFWMCADQQCLPRAMYLELFICLMVR